MELLLHSQKSNLPTNYYERASHLISNLKLTAEKALPHSTESQIPYRKGVMLHV